MKKQMFRMLAVVIAGVLFFTPQLKSQEKMVVAMLDFKNVTGEINYNYLQSAIPEMLATNLSMSDGITVLERERIEKILKESGLVMAGITEGDVDKIGKLLSAKQILSGSIVKTGKNIRIDARLTEVSSGKVVAAAKKECKNNDEIIDAVDQLSETIVTKITGTAIRFGNDIDRNIKLGSGAESVKTELTNQNLYYLSGSGVPFHVRAGFIAREIRQKKERVPLNISVVLDRSGSMSEAGKLDYAKDALKFIIKNLNKNDTLSIVVYDDSVDLLLPPEKVEDKDRLIALVDGIQPGGSTNLSGGMLEGYSQVQKNLKSGQVNRVLLISDGLANVGITDPDQIQQIVRKKAKENITISTFGLGHYFNEKLMTGISEYGNANYYYIDKADKVPDIFSRELSGLLSVAAQNCQIEIEPVAGTVFQNVYGYKYEKSGKKIVIKLGDIISEEKKLALISLIPKSKKTGKDVIAKITFIYDDANSGDLRVSRTSDVTVEWTDDKKAVSAAVNPVVMKDVDMFRSSEIMEKTIEMVEKGDIDSAKKKIDENLGLVKSSLKVYQSKELKKQALNIMEYQSNLRQMERMPAAEKNDFYQYNQKAGRSKQYEMQKKK